MGWICCFGAKKERARRLPSDGRGRQRNKEKPTIQANPPNLQSLGAHLKSAKEACAYEELFQPKQAVSSTPHGTKLFKRKSSRRTKSCGSSATFKNGLDKNAEGRKSVRVDRLQEEVEALKKKLAEEEEEARKLRNEVVYLRSCGLLQSPDRHRNSLSLEKDSSLPKDDKGYPNSPSWLGLTLSPTSRFKLEEQLRSMAADELSKIPDKGLTNGQKALIVATKLWQSEGGSHQKDYQTKRELVNSSCLSDSSHSGSSGQKWHPYKEEAISKSNQGDKEMRVSDHQLPSKIQDSGGTRSFYVEESLRRTMEVLKSPPRSSTGEIENFSFHPLPMGEILATRHLFPGSSPRRAVPVLQRISSCPEQAAKMAFSFGYETEDFTGKFSAPAVEKVSHESPKKSPKRSSSLPSGGDHTSDPPDHVQARSFIDLKYEELKEKLLKSPTKETVSVKSTLESSTPWPSKNEQPYVVVKDSEQKDLVTTTDVFCSEVQPASENEASIITDDIMSPSSAPVMQPFFVSKFGRLWQPLSPVREGDSAQTSVEDGERTSASQPLVSDSVDSSLTSDLKSSVGTGLSGNEWEQQQEGFPQHEDDMNEVLDDDLFTLSPQRLHDTYSPWDDAHRPDEDFTDECKTVLHVDSGSVTGGTSSEETDLDDFVPIQCQSPVFSPKRNSSRNKFAKEKVLNVLVAQQDTWSERATLCCDSNIGGEGHNDVQSPTQELVSGPELSDKDNLPTFEFSVLHDESSHHVCDDLDEEARLRLSLHGFVYPDEHVLNLEHSRSISMENLVQEQGQDHHHQNETDIMIDEVSYPGLQATFESFRTQFAKGVNGAASLAELEDHQKVDTVSSEQRLSTLPAEQVEKEKPMILDNGGRHDVLSHDQSLGYSIQVPQSRADSLSFTEDAFESPCVGGDSEFSTTTSRDGDDAFLDCESPIPSEPAHCNGYQQAEAFSEPMNDTALGLSNALEEVPPGQRMVDISPDDRPILGTVATHWGENDDPKSLREWDGLGIPNSTSKFKEDQKVNWHTTPFETRLEQALAKLPIVPELCNQRNLFGGVAMM